MFSLTYPKSEGCEGAVMHPSLLVFWGYGGGDNGNDSGDNDNDNGNNNNMNNEHSNTT